MKTKLVLLALVSTFSLQPSALLGQGSLTPPGAPAPTMKSLAQMEPRTPISTVPFTISVPGSYYLTTNVTVSSGDAITIATNNVTLDLNGFTISSTAASATGYGIRVNDGLRDLAILNGFIKGGVTNNAGTFNGPGFAYGIFYPITAPSNTRIVGVSVSGCLTYGIHLGQDASTVVESCTVRTVGTYGILASVIKSSTAVECGSSGMSGNQVSDSHGESVSGSGLGAVTAQNCYGRSYGGGIGLAANNAQNCYGRSDSSIGLRATDVAVGCTGYSVSGIGLQAYIANSCKVSLGTTNITFKYNMP